MFVQTLDLWRVAPSSKVFVVAAVLASFDRSFVAFWRTHLLSSGAYSVVGRLKANDLSDQMVGSFLGGAGTA